MEKALALHVIILKDIQTLIGQKCEISTDSIKPVNFTIEDGNIMKFQLSFVYTAGDPDNEIFLNFQINNSFPHRLHFEALSGLKGYERSTEYHGLESEIIKYIDRMVED